MKKNNYKTNWFYILLGLLFSLGFFAPINETIDASDLEKKTVVVDRNMRTLKGGKNKNAYRFSSNEYACSFVIKSAGGLAAHWKNLQDIVKTDTLTIEIHQSRITDLDKKSEDVPVYSLVKNGQLIYDVNAYNDAQRLISARWRIIFIIPGILFLLSGLNIISNRMVYIVAALGVVTVIVLRSYDIW